MEPAKGGFFRRERHRQTDHHSLSTAELRYPQADNFLINAKAYPGKRDDAFEEMRGILRKLRHTPANEENDFDLTTPDQIVKQFDQVSSLIILASIAISGLGLLVGGIGVMNIMLVSVTERTREIGVRKALGARKIDIIFQFLMEAITLTGVGGAVGIAFSMMVHPGRRDALPRPALRDAPLGHHGRRWDVRSRRCLLRRLAGHEGRTARSCRSSQVRIANLDLCPTPSACRRPCTGRSSSKA